MVQFHHLEKWWSESQWEGWHPIYEMEIKKIFETTNQLYMYHEKWGFNPSKNRGKWIEMVVWLRNHCDCWFMIAVCWLSSPKSNHSLMVISGLLKSQLRILKNSPRRIAKKEQSGYILHLAVCQNLVPLVNIKIAGKWMFIPLKMVLIGIDPYPFMAIRPTIYRPTQ